MELRKALSLPVAGICFYTSTACAAFICPALDAATNRAMQGWQVPGLAIAVIKNGKTVYQEAFGLANVDNATPVTHRTLFGIGSITKSVTALGFALSDVRKELPLDTPVRSVLPYFPADVTIRHLLSHRAGWPRHDALWYLNAYDSHTLPRKLSRLPRYAKAGASFQYNNVPFAAVGEVLTKTGKTSWSAWVRHQILDAAGMTSAVTRLSEFRNSPLRATPYFPAREGRITLPLRDTDPVAPAAGIYADIRDMTRYTALLANKGRHEDKQIVPARAVSRLWTNGTKTYGLGMRLGKWRGHKLAFHPGFIDGYGARISVLPQSGSGVVVLTNLSGETPTTRIVSQTVLDCLTDAPATDWVARFGHRRPPPKAEAPMHPPEPLQQGTVFYRGTYGNPAYGRIEFAGSGGDTLTGSFHGRHFDLTYAGNDRWRLTETHWPLRRGLEFSFLDASAAGFATVSAPLADGPTYRHKAGPIVFTRIPLPSGSKKPD